MKQKVILIGNLGKDPDMRYIPDGTASVTKFSLACNRKYKQDGKTVTETVWFKVETWGKLSEICNDYLSKGDLVEVEGRMRPARIWFGDDNEPRCELEVRADSVLFLKTKKGESTQKDPKQQDIPGF